MTSCCLREKPFSLKIKEWDIMIQAPVIKLKWLNYYQTKKTLGLLPEYSQRGRTLYHNEKGICSKQRHLKYAWRRVWWEKDKSVRTGVFDTPHSNLWSRYKVSSVVECLSYAIKQYSPADVQSTVLNSCRTPVLRRHVEHSPDMLCVMRVLGQALPCCKWWGK